MPRSAFFGGANWAPNLDNPQNKAFVAAYEKEYGAVPATYAFQAYDAAMLIDSAVRAVKGNVGDKDALRAALKKADFKSLRGRVQVQQQSLSDPGLLPDQGRQAADGKYQTEIVKKVFADYADPLRQGLPDEVSTPWTATPYVTAASVTAHPAICH